MSSLFRSIVFSYHIQGNAFSSKNYASYLGDFLLHEISKQFLPVTDFTVLSTISETELSVSPVRSVGQIVSIYKLLISTARCAAVCWQCSQACEFGSVPQIPAWQWSIFVNNMSSLCRSIVFFIEFKAMSLDRKTTQVISEKIIRFGPYQIICIGLFDTGIRKLESLIKN